MQYKVLKIGSKGDDVKELQRKLNFILSHHLKLDGEYGKKTFAAVSVFQDMYILYSDGIAGQKTQTKLNEIYNELFPQTKSLRERLECTLTGTDGHIKARPPEFNVPLTELNIRNGFNDIFHQIVKYLNVEGRTFYKKRQNKNGTWSTYCNVYAYHFLCYTWAYIPRVWWNGQFDINLIEGYDATIQPVYGENCKEMNANALYDWLVNEGEQYFGWKEVETEPEFQAHVNTGAVGVICAKRKDKKRSGHITVGIPTNEHHKMVNGVPLQSDAGWTCHNYHNIAWYLNDKFEAYGFFICEQPNK
jgi:hypothetical protein